MGLKVIGAGFGRTGTLSLKTALEILGFGPCYHMVEVFAHPEHLPLWTNVIDGNGSDWDGLFGDYRASVDWPACHFYAELADFYPEAKVVLSLRDPERWYDSMRDTILPSLSERHRAADAAADAAATPPAMAKIAGIISRDTFNMDFSKDNVIAAFERHNAEVRRSIPAERLLVFEAAQGWEPLCAHLGVAVPEQPYPRVNDREEFQTHVSKAREMGM